MFLEESDIPSPVAWNQGVEPFILKMTAAGTSSAAATTGPKVSMFAKKAGFVIPKNKLSGSLVPIFRGKKGGGTDTANGEASNKAQRKTKWGPDMTQDAGVRKGRALAYQTRIDQITKQLKSGNLAFGDDKDAPSSAEHENDDSSNTLVDSKKAEPMEIERREIIGEILKLNPSYKAPPDYKPLLKEEIVPIPVKEYPGYNFIGLIFGPEGDTQKRFEKDTGAKVQVYGKKANTGDKVEISSADSNDILSTFEELYVQISADSYGKVDAAVSLIELLITSIKENIGAGSTSVSEENKNLLSQTQGLSASYTVPTINPGMPQLTQASSRDQFQYQGPWTPTSMPPQNFSAPLLNNPAVAQLSASNAPLSFVTQPGALAGYNSMLPNPSFASISSNQPIHPLNYTGQPRNPPILALNPTAVPPNARPMPPPFLQPPSRPSTDRPVAPAGSSAGWSGVPPSQGPINMAQLAPPAFPPQGSHSMFMHPGGAQLTSVSSNRPASMAYARGPPMGSSPAVSTSLHQPPLHAPIPSQSSAQAMPVAQSVTGSRPLRPISGDFTFQPLQPQNTASQVIPRPGIQQASPHAPSPGPMARMQAPQAPPFRFPGHNLPPQPVMQSFPRQQQQGIINHMSRPQAQMSSAGHVGAARVAQMGMRNFIPAPNMPNMVGPFPPRHGNPPMQPHQNYPGPPPRPGNYMMPNPQFGNNLPHPTRSASPHFRGPQAYDPFSRNSVSIAPQHKGGNFSNAKKQENDPEYEDLMASVGVK